MDQFGWYSAGEEDFYLSLKILHGIVAGMEGEDKSRIRECTSLGIHSLFLIFLPSPGFYQLLETPPALHLKYEVEFNRKHIFFSRN